MKREGYNWRCSMEKGALKNFAKWTGKHLCQLYQKRDTDKGVFPCGFSEIFKNNFFMEYLQ